MGNAAPNVAKEFFGALPDGRAVERLVLRGAGGFEASIITYARRFRRWWCGMRKGSATTSCSVMTI